ncbi:MULTISPECIES: heavy metal-responsive transcriptional regulator [unclassified Pseudomonas]|uniref:heavy metal-responsive transcriptional regulator n=1 Tax=unclassified Pseudomonas TaxID=196821 RepID=UPI000C86B258|nr:MULTISPECIES: heavy metal-responsive transcriptional regulator [unclassified Pseudomonas]PMU22953.1 heavy metal-responsive transcriptional regulator [Pseudomonas sp. GP01-A9]PMU28535.1 heavy metal-responsive transcriptional regulator [Pseudomonas sp. GP01-A13]PMU38787.1 heavy metal-responsive transcriptional regulator [Pseudomonas sp. GP01-A8]PMU52405.1 heavy metal-responsive transcriptional regulator [Pseudomonas sp. GP01-A6]PMU54402.1 heavy metal-responsive transcriptional regulator [Pseu
MLTIGKLATLAGTTPNTLRYYEREGLIPPPAKGENGYRLYPQDAARRVHFIRQAQQCGFTLSEIRELLALPQQASACCSDVRKLAIEKKLALEAKIKLMRAMSAELDRLINDCVHDSHPLDDCPILNALNHVTRETEQ